MRGPVAALLVALCALSAAGSEPLRLGQALALVRTGPSLRAASAEVDVARAHLVQAGLPAANPVVTGELSRHADSSDAFLDRGILISQEVEIGGQRGLRVSAALHDVERAEHRLAERRRRLEAGVRLAFAELVAAGERRELAVDSVALARRIQEIAERRARAGDAGELEVRLARIEMLRAEQALAGAETDRTRAAGALASAVDAGPEASFEAVSEEAGPVPPLDEEALVAWALALRPDLASARAEREQLEGEARAVHRGGLIPNPVLGAFYRRELDSEQIAGGEVSVPIPIWNRAQGTEAALLAGSRRAAAEAERLAREIPREVQLALARRAAAARAWARWRGEALPAMSAAGELVERASAGGYLGIPEVLMQRDRLLAIRSAAIAARLELAAAEAGLVEAAGGELP